jgi:Ca2+-binding EF-hand superfamily protein
MAKRIPLIFFIMIAVSVAFIRPAAAVPAKSEKLKHADKNKDGTVDKKERHMEEEWEHKQRSKVNTWWEKRADTNHDGTVDSNELAAWKKLTKERIDLNQDGVIDAKEKRLSWRHAFARVNTPLEQKYDKNGDGWLEPGEIRELLKDKALLIQTNGKAKVDTPHEAEYDANGDGVLDRGEAKTLKSDLEIK